jgi:uncharacterized membrane protein
MNKAISLALVVIGIVLLVYGINASNSTASSISNAISGNPTDRSIWLICGGALGIVAGGVGLIFSSRRS